MLHNFTFTIAPASAGARLNHAVLTACPTSTRTFVLEAIARGDVLLNDRTAPKGTKVSAGDRILVLALLEQADKRVIPQPELPLAILHRDDALLVLDKPAGMPVHPLQPGETGTLANALLAREPALAAIGDDPLFPAILHRLDTDTSGVMLAARTPDAYAFLREEFHLHRVHKEYVALVLGSPPDTARLQHYLAHHPARPGFMRAFDDRPANYAGPRLMQAVTEFRVRTRFARHALLDVTIATGVTHQIRAQLAAAGFPLVGDTLYGAPPGEKPSLARHFLHAAAITATHPLTRQPARFEAPLAPELQGFLNSLRP